MTMNMPLPSNLTKTAPGQVFESEKYIFDHVPSLAELLPQYRGLPGYEYMQCSVTNLRRAQDEGWTEVERTVIYTVKGPKGEVSMKLLARGARIPGQPHDSGARLCLCDKSVEKLTGIFINPHHHKNEAEDGGSTQKSDTTKPAPVGGKSNAPRS